jgi:hypothetical protein
MLEIMEHKIIAIRKNKSAKIHIKYLKNGVGKSICGNFSEHKGFTVDNLEEGVDSLQAILEDNNMCKRCLNPVKDNMERYGEGLAYALDIVWVDQSWNC